MKGKISRVAAFAIPAGVILLPLITLAQDVSTIDSWFDIVSGWISKAVPILIGVALLVFIWGLIGYINAGDDADKKKAARGTIIWGVIILAAIVGVWGLVTFVLDAVGIDAGGSITTPEVPI